MKKWGILLLIVLAFGVSVVLLQPKPVKAVTPVEDKYNSYMINDAEFTAHDSMSQQDIQTFLEQHVDGGYCDTWHQNPYGSNPAPPWTCLYQYRDPANGNKLASQIIKDAAEDYWVNPKVILVTLQKENSLITDNWPWPSQYQTAMGMGCPETSGCDTQYYGFTNQVRRGVSLLKAVYKRSCEPDGNYFGFNYFNTFANSYRNLDGKSTYVGNCATAAFYQYTPHRVDSAWNQVWDDVNQRWSYFYGNYNFVTYYNKWFNQGAYVQSNLRLSSSLTLSNYNAAIGENVTDSFTIKNNLNTPITLDKLLITGRDPNGAPVDYPIHYNVALAASGNQGDSVSLSDARSFVATGVHSVWVSYYYQGNWYNITPDAGKTNYMTFNVHKPNLTVTGFTFNPGTPSVGQNTSVNYSVKNNEGHDVTVDVLSVGNHLTTQYYPALDYGGYSPVTIPAGQAVALNVQRNFNTPGLYVAVVCAKTGNYWTDLSWGNGVSSRSYYNVIPFTPNVTAVLPLTISNTNPTLNESVSTSFRLRNKSSQPLALDRVVVTGRTPNGTPKDFPVQYNVNLAAFGDSSGNDFYSPSAMSTTFTDISTYRFWISYLYAGTWYNVNPDSDQAVSQNLTSRLPNLAVTQLYFTPATPSVNQPITITYAVKNNETKDVTLDVLSVGNHLYSMTGPNRDFGGYTNVTIPVGGTVTYSVQRTLTEAGSYVAVVVEKIGNVWAELNWGNGVSSRSYYTLK